MKEDKFESFIRSHRDAFDDLEPRAEIWLKIKKDSEHKTRFVWNNVLWKAASVLIIFCASFVANEYWHQYRNADIPVATAEEPVKEIKIPELLEAEVYYTSRVEQRLQELDSRPSIFNPLWYGMSFGIGAGAGLISDKISLGFVAATEEQVAHHLKSHLKTLPEQDTKSRAIVEQMLEDEEKHGHAALQAGGTDFPKPVKQAMTLVSKVMTALSYRL